MVPGKCTKDFSRKPVETLVGLESCVYSVGTGKHIAIFYI